MAEVVEVVEIVPMRRRHLRSVLRIEAGVQRRGWSAGLFLAELRREHDRVYLVAKVGGSVVGFGGVLLQGDDAHVTNIAVDPGWQGRRVGTRLMLVLAREAAARGAAHLTLEVRAGNEAAIALYRAFGLAPAGVRKGYYTDDGEDALILWAHGIAGQDYAERLARIAARVQAPAPAPAAVEGRARA